MKEIFFSSDLHLGHAKLLTFTNYDGSFLRPEFDDVEEMNEAIVERHNSVVGVNSKIYMLGDISMGKIGLELLARMNGEKFLIKGNHDLQPLASYMRFFKDVRGSHQFDGMVFTHIPIHPSSLGRWERGNVHGHLHSNQVMKLDCNGNDTKVPDPRYTNVSMEQINCTPIHIDALKSRIAMRQQLYK